jgi:hypothetical protein
MWPRTANKLTLIFVLIAASIVGVGCGFGLMLFLYGHR